MEFFATRNNNPQRRQHKGRELPSIPIPSARMLPRRETTGNCLGIYLYLFEFSIIKRQHWCERGKYPFMFFLGSSFLTINDSFNRPLARHPDSENPVDSTRRLSNTIRITAARAANIAAPALTQNGLDDPKVCHIYPAIRLLESVLNPRIM